LLSYTVGSSRYFVHSNHLFSPSAVTNAAGQVQERYRYDAYGKQTITTTAGTIRDQSAVGFGRGFTGYILDEETGLYYARARMYSAGLGRFIERDPLRYIDGFAMYHAYFSPNKLDPDGQKVGVERCTIELWLGHSGIPARGAIAHRNEQLEIQRNIKKNDSCGYRLGIVSCFGDENNAAWVSRNPGMGIAGLPGMPGLGVGVQPGSEWKDRPDGADDDWNYEDGIKSAIEAALIDAQNVCKEPCCDKVKIKITCSNQKVDSGDPRDYTNLCGKYFTISCEDAQGYLNPNRYDEGAPYNFPTTANMWRDRFPRSENDWNNAE